MQVKDNQFIKGAMLLTLVGLLSKVLGAAYRIPLQNITGDLGYYIYQQIYPFIGFVMILSLYGFPTAISNLTAAMQKKGLGISLRSFYIPIFIILLGMNGFLFVGLYVSAGFIANFIGDPQLVFAYRMVAFTFLLIPFTVLLRGVFQGIQDMKPTAYSQLGDQFIRVGMIILMAYFIITKGMDMYLIGEAAALASICGAIFAIIILSIFLMRRKLWTYEAYPVPWKHYVMTLLTFGIVASLNHLVLIILQFADVFSLVPNLKTYGLNTLAAMEEKGIFDRGQPLIQLGSVLGSSLAIAVIPAISKMSDRQNIQELKSHVESALKVCFYLSAGATIGLIGIFPEANILLFQNDKGTISLQVLAVAILFSSLAITGMSILQSLGKYFITIVYLFIVFMVKLLANHLLVPMFGITGSSIATILALFILCLLIYVALKRNIPALQLGRHMKIRSFLFAGGLMLGYLLLVRYVYLLLPAFSRSGLLFYILFVVGTGAMLYIYMLIRRKAFTEEELHTLPLASLWLRIYRY